MKKYIRLTKLSNIIERIEKGILGMYHIKKSEVSSCKDINFTSCQEFRVSSGKLLLNEEKKSGGTYFT